MPTNFPTGLDDGTSLPTRNPGDIIPSAETNTQSGAIKAIEAKLGISASTPASGQVLLGTGTGSSAWNPFAHSGLSGLTAGDPHTQYLKVASNLSDVASLAAVKATLGINLGYLSVSAASMVPTITSGAVGPVLVEYATNGVDHYVLDFADAAVSQAEFSVLMPLNWDASSLFVQVAWLVASATAGVCRWQVACTALGSGDAIDAALGTARIVDATASGVANQVRIEALSGAITPGGTPAAGELLHFRVTRQGAAIADTLTATARLLGLNFRYGQV